jgi:hypothetical protein
MPTAHDSEPKPDPSQSSYYDSGNMDQGFLGGGMAGPQTTGSSPMLPWISPGNMPPVGSNQSMAAPYGASTMKMNQYSNYSDASQQQQMPSKGSMDSMMGGKGGMSDFDLLNYPDAFASTSSLDLLGTLAEIKLPSATSLENLQKYGMDPPASTSSLSEWYASLGAQKSQASEGATPASQEGTSSGGGVYFHRAAPQAAAAPQTKMPAVVWRGVNGEILHPNSFLGPSVRGNAKTNGKGNGVSDNDEHGIRHSLSRELLNVVAAAANFEARGERESGSSKSALGGRSNGGVKVEQQEYPDAGADRTNSVDNFM